MGGTVVLAAGTVAAQASAGLTGAEWQELQAYHEVESILPEVRLQMEVTAKDMGICRMVRRTIWPAKCSHTYGK
jgi:hypothetical protein